MTTLALVTPTTTPDAPTAPDIEAMAFAYASAGFTPERVLAGRDTDLSRAVADAMRRLPDRAVT